MTDRVEANRADDFIRGLWRENPVFVQVLGMCPVLAVTNSALNGITMGLATLFVLVMSSAMVSALRQHIPAQVRIATFILIIATFVSVVDYMIQAVSLDMHRRLGAFISLIVVNCLILSRAEAFASRHGVGRSVLDALGMGLGFTMALLCMGGVREVLGSGSLFEVRVMPAAFQTWTIMVLPGGGFFTLGAWLLVINLVKVRRQAEAARVVEPS